MSDMDTPDRKRSKKEKNKKEKEREEPEPEPEPKAEEDNDDIDWKKLLKQKMEQTDVDVKKAITELKGVIAEKNERTTEQEAATVAMKRIQRLRNTLQRIVQPSSATVAGAAGFLVLTKHNWRDKDRNADFILTAHCDTFSAAFDKFVETTHQNCVMSNCLFPVKDQDGVTAFFKGVQDDYPACHQVFIAQVSPDESAERVSVVQHAKQILSQVEEETALAEQAYQQAQDAHALVMQKLQTTRAKYHRLEARNKVLTNLKQTPVPSARIPASGKYFFLRKRYSAKPDDSAQFLLNKVCTTFDEALEAFLGQCTPNDDFSLEQGAINIGDGAIKIVKGDNRYGRELFISCM